MAGGIVVVGNSIVRHLRIDGIEMVSYPGGTLYSMEKRIGELEAETKLVISGIPDLFQRGQSETTGPWLDMYRRDLERVSRIGGVILCPMYPVRSMPYEQWSFIQRMNHYICELNAKKGEGTPAIVARTFGRSGRGTLFFNKERLADEAHPTAEFAEDMSRVIGEFIERRQGARGTDLRSRIEKRRVVSEQEPIERKGTLEINVTREDRRIVEDRREEEAADSEEAEAEAIAKLARKEEEDRRQARVARRKREKEIRERIEKQLAQELQESEEQYRRDLDTIRKSREEAERRIDQKERERTKTRRREIRFRDRDARETEEPRMKSRDVRVDVPRRIDRV